MPIQLTCPTCGKKLQIGDQYAGKRVGCPGCKSVITAPGGAAASPPAPPAAPKVAPRPATPPLPPPPAAPKIPAPVAKPAPREEVAPAVDDNDFDFGAKRKKPDDSRDAPPKPKGRDKAPATAKRPARDSDDEDEMRPPSRSRRDPRSDSEDEKRYPSKTWQSFGSGSGMAKLGLWIEFFSLAYGVLLFGYVTFVLTEDPYGRRTGGLRDAGVAILIPLFLGSFVGVLFAFAGRTKMMSIPQGTGAKRVFLGAWLFTLLRFFAAVAGLGLIVLAATSNDLEQGRYAGLAFLALMIGLPFWGFADLSTIPAMAIVGGVIPSRNLRRQAGKVTFAMQIIMLIYVFLVVGFYAYENNSSRNDDFRMRRSSVSDAQTVIAIVLGVVLVLQLIYTLLYSALYSAGKKAVAELEAAEDRAADEDF